MKKNKKDEEIRLMEGSTYRVASVSSREGPMISQGVFVGFTSVGSDEGMCLRLDESHDDMEGKIRVIPTHIILAVDMINQKKESEDDSKDEDRTALYFG